MPPRSLVAFKIARTSATLFIPRLVSTTSSLSMTLALRFLPLDLPWKSHECTREVFSVVRRSGASFSMH